MIRISALEGGTSLCIKQTFICVYRVIISAESHRKVLRLFFKYLPQLLSIIPSISFQVTEFVQKANPSC